jgi:hypothetical protein
VLVGLPGTGVGIAVTDDGLTVMAANGDSDGETLMVADGDWDVSIAEGLVDDMPEGDDVSTDADGAIVDVDVVWPAEGAPVLMGIMLGLEVIAYVGITVGLAVGSDVGVMLGLEVGVDVGVMLGL